jgi:hypothetical protein
MNWDAIGAIAELLGAVGVIASLVYLATQIRQSREQMGENTRALRAGTYQQFQRELRDSFAMNANGSSAKPNPMLDWQAGMQRFGRR